MSSQNEHVSWLICLDKFFEQFELYFFTKDTIVGDYTQTFKNASRRCLWNQLWLNNRREYFNQEYYVVAVLCMIFHIKRCPALRAWVYPLSDWLSAGLQSQCRQTPASTSHCWYNGLTLLASKLGDLQLGDTQRLISLLQLCPDHLKFIIAWTIKHLVL